jgi:pimeloyl-ACP methyl ester carboxylesterase
MTNDAWNSLNSSCFAWAAQINHFSRLSNYSALVFDNRGVGYSDAPRGPYTYVFPIKFSKVNKNLRTLEKRTSGMAEDVIMLLDFLGWTAKRDLHIVGVSLGGMIAQGIRSLSSEHSSTRCL